MTSLLLIHTCLCMDVMYMSIFMYVHTYIFLHIYVYVYVFLSSSLLAVEQIALQWTINTFQLTTTLPSTPPSKAANSPQIDPMATITPAQL